MELSEAFEIITIIYERFLSSSTIPGLKGLGIGHTIKNTIDKSIAYLCQYSFVLTGNLHTEISCAEGATGSI